MSTAEKASYVAVARKIKEDFVALHPDARSRGGSRKGKRKLEKVEAGPRVAIRNVAPPSLHALAMIGSRLNQSAVRDTTPGRRECGRGGTHEPAAARLGPFRSRAAARSL